MDSVSAPSHQLIRMCSRASTQQEEVEDPAPLPSCFRHGLTRAPLVPDRPMLCHFTWNV